MKLIICLSPKQEDLEESLQTLKFAELTQDIKVNRPETIRYSPYVREIEAELSEGKTSSNMKELESESGLGQSISEKIGDYTDSNFESTVEMQKIDKHTDSYPPGGSVFGNN